MVDLAAIKARLSKLPKMGEQRKATTFDEDYDFGPMAEIWAPDLSGSLVYIPSENTGEIPPLLPFIAHAPDDIAAMVAEVEALREIRRRASDLAFELASVSLPPDAERLLSLLDDAFAEPPADVTSAIKCPSSEIGQNDGRFPLIPPRELWARSSWEVPSPPLCPTEQRPDMNPTQPDETPISRATLSLPWKGWTRTDRPEALQLVCNTAPIVVLFVPCRDGTWFGSYQIEQTAPVVLPAKGRLDRVECRVVWAIGKAINEERDLLARKQDAIAAMAVEADCG